MENLELLQALNETIKELKLKIYELEKENDTLRASLSATDELKER